MTREFRKKPGRKEEEGKKGEESIEGWHELPFSKEGEKKELKEGRKNERAVEKGTMEIIKMKKE